MGKTHGGVVYLCDRRFDDMQISEYRGFPIISIDRVKEMADLIVFICARDPNTVMQMTDSLVGINCRIRFLESEFKKVIHGKTLNDMGKGYYKDCFENIIEWENDIPDKLCIEFAGCHSKAHIADGVSIRRSLNIHMGTDADVQIGKDSSFMQAVIAVSHTTVKIGEDCMFSGNIIVRNSDMHHIFDMYTGVRINIDKSVIIGNHVWIGEGVRILKGADIGTGSVIGEASVVTGTIGDNVVAVGNPAKVVRRDVI